MAPSASSGSFRLLVRKVLYSLAAFAIGCLVYSALFGFSAKNQEVPGLFFNFYSNWRICLMLSAMVGMSIVGSLTETLPYSPLAGAFGITLSYAIDSASDAADGLWLAGTFLLCVQAAGGMTAIGYLARGLICQQRTGANRRYR